MPPPRSLANLKREISEEEAWTWSRNRVKGKKYQMRKTMHQNNMVARGPKRLAGRFHQLKTGHCRTGQYLKWTKNSDTAECGWCQYKTQTREHLFKNCDKWRPQQKIMWAEIRKKAGRGKNRFAIRELFADERCTGAILDFLRTTRWGRGWGRGSCHRNQGGRRRRATLSHTLFSFPFSFSLSPMSILASPMSFPLSLSLSFSLSFSFSSRGTGRAGAGGVAASRWRTARGRSRLLEGAADGEQERTVYNIVMIQ